MGGACRTHGKDEDYIQGFDGIARRKEIIRKI
jgi:hypothetical protein